MSSNIDLVIFGARGDLSKRKLFPALFELDRAGLLTDSVRIAGVARQDMDSVIFIEQMHEELKSGAKEGQDVHHKNGNPLDNRKGNLAVVSPSSNRSFPRDRNARKT